MFLGKDDFIRQYKEEFMDEMAKPFEECNARQRYEVLAKLICGKAARRHADTKHRHINDDENRVYY
ncbi:MAG: hypothetical protein Q4B18_06030, partial [Bacillota bacterium]|nr:hypothetical protein [Bacillota bacterium]